MLTALFTQSIMTGELPEDWRNANISPIFEKGDRHIVSNYRPVCLTCVCFKLLEHIICHHVREHLVKPLQHGFRRGYSCETQLLMTLHDLMSLLDRKLQVDVAVLDFSKAFDTVPHDKLMDKLEYYGINGNIHQWMANFLKQRDSSA